MRRRVDRDGPLAVALVVVALAVWGLESSRWGAWLRSYEQAWTLSTRDNPEPARELVILDLEGWPADPYQLSATLETLADPRAGRPKLVALDILGNQRNSLLSLWIDDGQIFPDDFLTPDEPSLHGRLVVGTLYDAEGAEQLEPLHPSLESAFVGSVELGAEARTNPYPTLNRVALLRRNDHAEVGGIHLILRSALLHLGGAEAASIDALRLHQENLTLPESSNTVQLDDGTLWLLERPDEARFRRIPAREFLTSDAPGELVEGKVVLVGSVRGEHQDWHLTPWGWVPGLLINAQLLDQLLSGRSVRPCLSVVSRCYVLGGALLACLVVWGLGAIRGVAVCVASIAGVFAAAQGALVWEWSLLPSWTPALGIAVGGGSALLARNGQMRRALTRFGAWEGGQTGAELHRLFQRVWLFRTIANESVAIRPADDSDPAYAAQRKKGLVFKNSERLLFRVYGQRWEVGSFRGLKELTELLHMALYECSGDLRRVPEPLKTSGSWIFSLKFLRNFFVHSYDVRNRELTKHGAYFEERGLPPVEQFPHASPDVLEQIQRALLEGALEFVQTVERDLREEHPPQA